MNKNKKIILGFGVGFVLLALIFLMINYQKSLKTTEDVGGNNIPDKIVRAEFLKLKDGPNTTADWNEKGISLPLDFSQENKVVFDMYEMGDADYYVPILDFDISDNFLFVLYSNEEAGLYLDIFDIRGDDAKLVARRGIKDESYTIHDISMVDEMMVVDDYAYLFYGYGQNTFTHMIAIDLTSEYHSVLEDAPSKINIDYPHLLEKKYFVSKNGDYVYIFYHVENFITNEYENHLSIGWIKNRGKEAIFNNITLDKNIYGNIIDLEIKDDILYVLNQDGEIKIFKNISTPIGSLFVRDGKQLILKGDKMVVRANEEIRIVDVSNSEKPVLGGEIKMSELGFRVSLNEMVRENYYYHNMDMIADILGDYFVIVNNYTETINKFDISEINNPIPASLYKTTEHIYDIKFAQDGSLFSLNNSVVKEIKEQAKISFGKNLNISLEESVGNHIYGFKEGEGCDLLYSVDVSDLDNPFVVSNIHFDGGCVLKVLQDGKYFVGHGLHPYDGITVYDISDPPNPVNIGFLRHTGPRYDFGDAVVEGNYAYIISSGTNKQGYKYFLDIYDISNYGNPVTVLSDYEIALGLGGLEINMLKNGNILLVNAASWITDSYITHEIDVSNPAQPVLIDRYPVKWREFIFIDDYVYMMEHRGDQKVSIHVSRPEDLKSRHYLDSVYIDLGGAHSVFGVKLHWPNNGSLSFEAGDNWYFFDISNPEVLNFLGMRKIGYCHNSERISFNKILCDSSIFKAKLLYELPYMTSKKQAQSLKINKGDEDISRAVLKATDRIPDSSKIEYYLSNNGGKDWFVVENGSEFVFDEPGNDLRFKVKLFTDDRFVSPEIYNINVDYKK